jgi:hypothetical protein
MSPTDAGAFEVTLRLLVIARRSKVLRVETVAGFSARELDHMADASLFRGVDESALRLKQQRSGRRDHQDSVNTGQCSLKCMRDEHVTDDSVDGREGCKTSDLF